MEPVAVQIQRRGLTIDRAQVSKLSAEFRDAQWVRLPRLLDPSLLDFVQARLDNCQWETMSHGDIGDEYITKDFAAFSLLHFAANLPKFRAVIEEITGYKSLRWFRGRIYRMIAEAGHHDSWHDDRNHLTDVGMSMNLSRNCFRGGLFMFRESGSKRILARVANTVLGDAILFRISRGLEHRISDLEGPEPKSAYAGWFRTDLPDHFSDSGAQVSAKSRVI